MCSSAAITGLTADTIAFDDAHDPCPLVYVRPGIMKKDDVPTPLLNRRMSFNYRVDGEIPIPCLRFSSIGARLCEHADGDPILTSQFAEIARATGVISITGAFDRPDIGPGYLKFVAEQLRLSCVLLSANGLQVWSNNLLVTALAAYRPSHTNEIRRILYESNWLPDRRHWAAAVQFSPLVACLNMRLGAIDGQTACIAYGSTDEIEATVNANRRTVLITPEQHSLVNYEQWLEDERVLGICGYREKTTEQR